MSRRYLGFDRLQRKVIVIILVIVVVPMLLAGVVAAEWVSSNFEARLERWIVDAARVDQTWLEANQNDAVMLGNALADDPEFVERLDRGDIGPIKQPVGHIAQELGITFFQVYNAQQILLYTSTPVEMPSLWELGQTQAVLKAGLKNKKLLAAIGITPVPRKGTPRYHLVLGSLLDRNFVNELSHLTGLKTRLYYREGNDYFDVFTQPGRTVSLKHLPKAALRRLQKDKKPYYSVEAENGKFRGQYTPIMDARGHVEAIIFSGLERRGFEEVLTNRVVLFVAISLLGIAIGGLAGVLLSRLVVRPVELLRDGVLQLSGQNFNATVPITSDDELGDLAKAFNAMAVRLRAARDEQQQLFQRDKLAALGELSAALAHEIRNPIGVINTASVLLHKPDQTPEKTAELVRMIREESARVSHLVQDFLQLSRYRQPKLAIIDPAVPMERALGAVLAGVDNIRVHKHLAHGDAHILGDAGLLQQAWGNIITNALQAIDGGRGEIWLESRREDGQVVLAIEDNGPGIPAEIMPRLFEPFFTTKEQGTGLGLSIANTLTEASGGELETLTPAKGGARFAMRFPVHQGVQS